MIDYIVIDDLSQLYHHEDYIKLCCKEVKEVFVTAIYFKDGNNPASCGVSIAFHGHPDPLTSRIQAVILKAINAACNTNFVLREKGKNA